MIPCWASFLLLGMVGLHPATAQIVHPHHNDPQVIQHEHMEVFKLVPDDDATHVAIASGDWSDPSVWRPAEVPAELSKVIISSDVIVTVDKIQTSVHKTIRVDGILTFATNVHSGLMVDTMIVSPSGTLEMGTEAKPIAAGVEAKLIIADPGPIDLEWDPKEFSRGLICHGTFTAHGQAKTSHLDLLEPALGGQKDLVLTSVPENWEEGDILILPGTHSRRDFDETLVITSISGNRVSVAGLADDGSLISGWKGFSHQHHLPNGLMPFVINLSRNVAIESENVWHADDYGINRRRGHIMFMHSGVSHTNISYLGLYGLGRTDKRTPLESPEFDAVGNRVPNTGFNTAGRYACHFHRGGPASAAAVIKGLSIVDSPGLGLVNHSSNVEVSDSVAYNVVGSAFFTEAGDEVGFFKNVAAVRMPGSGEGIESRRMPAGVLQEVDFGHSGHGLWLQGGGVEVIDARVAGAGNSAIIFFTVALDEPGLGKAKFDGSLLPENVAVGRTHVDVGQVPIYLKGAYIFGSRTGLETKFHQLSAHHGVPSVLDQALTAHVGTPLSIQYTNNLTVSKTQFVGNESHPGGHAMQRNNVTRSITFESTDILWFSTGIDIPVNGHNRVIGGSYANVRDINISTTKDDDRLVEILGDVAFLELSEAQLTLKRKGQVYLQERYHVYLRTNYRPDDNDLTRMFARDIIRMGTLLYQNHQIFYYAQAADFVPFPSDTAADYVPVELINRTNQQLWDTYGISIGDAIAPSTAFEDPLIHALIGNPIEYAPKICLRSRKYTNDLTDYRLRYDVYLEDGKEHRKVQIGDISEGWNIYTFQEAGWLRSAFVFGDTIAPEFVLSSQTDSVVNPEDLKKGFRVLGTIQDNSFGSRPFKKVFEGSYLLALTRLTRGDGSEYVELKFIISDFASNQTEVVFELTIDPAEPRAHVKRRKVNNPRLVTVALKSLLGFTNDN
jgi:hypothetical protein